MPSPFDKVTKSGELRNFLANQPVIEQVAKSQDTIFQSEMNRLGLQERQKEIAMKDESLQTMRSYDEQVASQATSAEDLLKRTRDFVKSNPRNASAIMDYASKTSSLFDTENKNKLSAIELEQKTRENEIQREFDGLQRKTLKAKLESDQLKFAQEQTNAMLADWKTNKTQVDGVTNMFATIKNLGLNKETQDGITNVSNYFYKKINDLAGRDDSQSKLEAQKYYDQANSIFAPLLEFDAVNRTLRSSYSVKHAETQTKAQGQYQPQFMQWAASKTAEGVDPSTLNFEGFLIDAYNTRDTEGSVGNIMMRTKDQAEMLEDVGELAQAKNQFQSYNKALLSSIDPVTGMPREDRMGSIALESAAMRNTLGQSMTRSKLRADTYSQQLEQRKALLDNLKTETGIKYTEGRLADMQTRTKMLQESTKKLESEKTRIENAIIDERSKEATPGGANEKRTKLIEDLQAQLGNVNKDLEIARSSAAVSSSPTDSVTAVE